MQIETKCKQIENVGDFSTLPNERWLEIKSGPAYLRRDDFNLKNSLDKLYEKIKEFNDSPDRVRFQTREIVNRYLKIFYGEETEVHYFVKHEDGEGAPALYSY